MNDEVSDVPKWERYYTDGACSSDNLQFIGTFGSTDIYQLRNRVDIYRASGLGPAHQGIGDHTWYIDSMRAELGPHAIEFLKAYVQLMQ